MADSKESNCKKCSGIDTDEMVQCDACDQWYHYGCVGVDNNVADISWSCENCTGASSMSPIIANSKQKSTEVQGPSSVFQTLPSARYEAVQQANVLGNASNNIHMFPMTTAVAPPFTSDMTAPLATIYKAPIMSQLPPMFSHHLVMPSYPQLTLPANYVHASNSFEFMTKSISSLY